MKENRFFSRKIRTQLLDIGSQWNISINEIHINSVGLRLKVASNSDDGSIFIQFDDNRIIPLQSIDSLFASLSLNQLIAVYSLLDLYLLRLSFEQNLIESHLRFIDQWNSCIGNTAATLDNSSIRMV